MSYTPESDLVQELYTLVMTSRPIDADATRTSIADKLNAVAAASSKAMLGRITQAVADAAAASGTMVVAPAAKLTFPAGVRAPAVRVFPKGERPNESDLEEDDITLV